MDLGLFHAILRRDLIVAFCALVLLAAGGARDAGAQDANVLPRAQDEPIAQIEERRQALFRRMMADPAELDTAFEYAALSSRAGDLESAIATLERMLIFAPDMPRLQLELGVLYFRLGSYELSRTYFESVLEAPGVPVPVTLRVERYLAAIRERTVRNRFDGVVMFGVRHQTNANGGITDRIISLNRNEVILSDAALASSDTDAFFSASFHFSHDFETQGDRFDVDLQTYGAFHARHDEINIGLAELRAGPVFNLARFGLDDTELGVHAILGGVVLKDDLYRVTAGVGTSLRHVFSPWTQGALRFEYRHHDVMDSDLRPTASGKSGHEFSFGGSLQHRLTERFNVYTRFDVDRRDLERGFDSNWQVQGVVGANYSFGSPFSQQQQLWTIGLAGGVARRTFDEPDPVIMAWRERRDTERFARATLTVPLRETWAMQAVVGYRDVKSNYALNTFDNLSTSLGVMKRF